uniref:Pseudouridine synthase I TruA alpha/beta domain-containing protein n=1 Tax=Clastoptera arizonana TaxID=38151 RepID=A0A1B6CQ65_9HEMI
MINEEISLEPRAVEIIKKVKSLTTNELNKFSKEELINKVIQLSAHNTQLKNIINKKKLTNDVNEQPQISKRSFDFSRCNKKHILIKLLYLGWDYQGFATQEDTIETIEHHLFEALIKSCLIESRQTSNYHRCGRTDKGVSSFGQVISISLRCSHEGQPELKYCKILNRLLPKNIRTLAWRPVSADFSARFNCSSRTYKYFFPQGELNIKVMNEAAQFLIGTNDFRNLCKMDVGNGIVNFTRIINKANIEVLSEHSHPHSSGYNMCVFTLEGQGFLWHQVRCIMGLLLLVGFESEQPQIIKDLLNVNKHPKKPQYSMAHEVPLNLYHCTFEFENTEGDWVIDKKSLSEVVKTLQQTWSLLTIKETMVGTMLEDISKGLLDIPQNDQASGLLQGVKRKVYIPLLERPKCESLESRIEHYVKKKRIQLKNT